MAFVFYDTETTGTNRCFDQVLQFAAIRTDDNLNELESFSIRCRLLPHIVPSPGALLTTGVSVADLTRAPLSHFEMMRQVHAKLNEWCPEGVIFMGWNSMRFDEGMLRQAYYQSLLPVYQTNTNGNGRADVMRMIQVVAACIPDAIAVPVEKNCKPTFKLGPIAEANGIRLDNAHEALADAGATLAIARLIKQGTPQIWSELVANSHKANVLQLLENNLVLFISETFGGTAYNRIVAPICFSDSNPNEWAVFDLQFDPEPLAIGDEHTLRSAIDGKEKLIRRVKVNEQPALLPIEFAPLNVRGGRLPMETYVARARKVHENSDFRERISRLLPKRYDDQPPPISVEQRIYDCFPSRGDQARLAAFHRHEWPARIGVIPSIEDGRYRELGERIIAVEQPQLQTPAERSRWQTWRRDRVLSTGDTPWLTVPGAMAKLDEIAEDAEGEQGQQFNDIRKMLTNLAAECGR